MPIKKDGSGKRWVEMEILVPGTPEQVWQAVATGPGNAGWFVKGEIEPRVGGAFSLDFGEGMLTHGEVTAWEPPRHFGYVEREWDAGAPPVYTEITITGRAGDQCVLRMVHTLFTDSDDWDNQVEGFESGWPGAFAVLRMYLAHYIGQRAASFMKMRPASGNALDVWTRLCETLGLAGANVGERRSLQAGPEAGSGLIEHIHQDQQQRYLMLRLETPHPGLLMIGTYARGVTSHSAAGAGTNVSLCRFFYGDQSESLAAESRTAWGDWLAASFPEPVPAAAVP